MNTDTGTDNKLEAEGERCRYCGQSKIEHDEIFVTDGYVYECSPTYYELEASSAQRSPLDVELDRLLEPIRRALSSRGYCGDGGLAQLVGRALDEAGDKGARKATAPLHAALAEAESFISKYDDPDDRAYGTLGERLEAATHRHAERMVARETNRARQIVCKRLEHRLSVYPGALGPEARLLNEIDRELNNE